jgi:hypothetical protein
VHEIYRLLGAEREAELEREARRHDRAAAPRRPRQTPVPPHPTRELPSRLELARARLAALLR